MAPDISVTEFYVGKSILITGATGFMGTVLVEKLLRSCPEVKTLYLLMRTKRDQTPTDRLQQFIKCKAFDNLRKWAPKQLGKLRLIPGDILQERLGLSREDEEEMEKECQIVFHFAACVRFDIPLRDSINQNTVGTFRVLQLAEKMKHLEVFLHSSTSFCHDEQKVVEEKLYPGRFNPHDIMHITKWMDDKLLNALEPIFVEIKKPNVYAFTKALAEDLVAEYAGKFPIAVARPSIVTAALKEPLPGWIDNINGPSGVIYAASRGVLHTMHCHESTKVDSVPVDMVINGCIILAKIVGVQKPKEVRICNLTQSDINTMTYVKAATYWRSSLREYPLSLCLWYPTATATNYKIYNEFLAFFIHWLPALFADFLLLLLRRKPFLFKIQKRIHHGLQVIAYYNTKDWDFRNTYFRSFKNIISKRDNEIFYTDMNELKWPEYIENYVKGIRAYYVGEDDSTLPYARKNHRRLYALHVTAMTIFWTITIYFLYRNTYLFIY